MSEKEEMSGQEDGAEALEVATAKTSSNGAEALEVATAKTSTKAVQKPVEVKTTSLQGMMAIGRELGLSGTEL